MSLFFLNYYHFYQQMDFINSLKIHNITNSVKYMERFTNDNMKNNNTLSIIGIDCQGLCPKYKSNSKTTNYVTNLVQKYNNNPTQGTRDKYMYKIFMKQFNINKKYVIFGHNAHLQKEKYDVKDNRIWF